MAQNKHKIIKIPIQFNQQNIQDLLTFKKKI